MCGIFGLALTEPGRLDVDALRRTTAALFRLSETRGREAAGIAVLAPDAIHVYREPLPASAFVRRPAFRQVFQESLAAPRPPTDAGSAVIIGHSRLVTNGSQELDLNNQPVVADGLVAVHNGIIVNDAELWRRFPQLQRCSEVDTEILLRLIGLHARENESLAHAIRRAFVEIRGTASVAALFGDRDLLLLATNNGSLYVAHRPGTALAFASESYILRRFLARHGKRLGLRPADVQHCDAGSAMLLDVRRLDAVEFALGGGTLPADIPAARAASRVVRQTASTSATAARPGNDRVRRASTTEQRLAALVAEGYTRVPELRRCTRCILPETMPFIEFDGAGVCNYCRNHVPLQWHGREALEAAVRPFRRADGRPEAVLALSGGRDSTFALHYVRTVLGLNPLAYTYDWGMVTDLARRNIARICGKLGVEHILVSADIPRKRAYIRMNVLAWLRRPDLGTVPLFMAGDKQFFHHANRLRRQLRIPLLIFSMNPLERTDFKTGFCGVPRDGTRARFYSLSPLNRLRLAFYYARQYAANPAYLNASLWDTLGAFASYYLLPQDYLQLYQYIRWDETTVERTLLDEYDFERAPDTRSTWRIGDGTASFYNYIYYTAAGFCENDTFRSNQIREGLLDRQTALRYVREENRPRLDSLRWYCDTIGIDCEAAIRTINAMPKRFEAAAR